MHSAALRARQLTNENAKPRYCHGYKEPRDDREDAVHRQSLLLSRRRKEIMHQVD